MGIYLNPGNIGFRQIRRGTYVDKTGLISFVNRRMDTPDRMFCVSRPRRFGKSFAAKMLCAYYDRNCDSRALFQGLKISLEESFEKYLNRFDVIYLDITRFLSRAKDRSHVVSDIQSCVIRDLRRMYPDALEEGEGYLPDALASVTQITGSRFFIIIDEWDALFREARRDNALQEEYVELLRGLFKGGMATDLTIAGAYLTGILPIKKYGTESALTDFEEFSMVDPLGLAEYVGFTEEEVANLCRENSLNLENMHTWYDGYSFSGVQHIYSPNSVMSAVRNRKFKNYWTKTETYESLKDYISMNFDGLRDAVIAMLGGQRVRVNTLSFQNDMTSFQNKDDILTLLVHLGYLAYEEDTCQVYIPNLEAADSFSLAVRNSSWQEVREALADSEDLLSATIRGDCEAVAEALERIHESSSSILQYNNEDSLSCAITIAYYTARRDYTIIRELPSGKGFADLAFIPRPGTDRPAMIIELKYATSADSAITQIREQRYTGVLEKYLGNLLLVGVSYNRNGEKKKHFCVIEKV